MWLNVNNSFKAFRETEATSARAIMTGYLHYYEPFKTKILSENVP
jgi:hypothetical protein